MIRLYALRDGLRALALALGVVIFTGGLPVPTHADVRVGIGVGYGHAGYAKGHHRFGHHHKGYRYGYGRKGYRYGHRRHSHFGGPRFYGRTPVYVPKGHRSHSTLFERRREVAYSVGLEHGRIIRRGGDDSAFKSAALGRLQQSGMALADIMPGGVYQFAYEASYFRGKDGG